MGYDSTRSTSISVCSSSSELGMVKPSEPHLSSSNIVWDGLMPTWYSVGAIRGELEFILSTDKTLPSLILEQPLELLTDGTDMTDEGPEGDPTRTIGDSGEGLYKINGDCTFADIPRGVYGENDGNTEFLSCSLPVPIWVPRYPLLSRAVDSLLVTESIDGGVGSPVINPFCSGLQGENIVKPWGCCFAEFLKGYAINGDWGGLCVVSPIRLETE